MTNKLEFDAGLHEYRLAGRVIPSVTQVIASHVPQWQASQWHMDRGTDVHEAVAMALKGKLDWASVDERIHARVRSILDFIAAEKLDAVAVEIQLASVRYQFAGTLDFVGLKEGPALVLCDWKGTITPAAEIQLGAYALMWAEDQGSPIGRAVAVECGDDGKYRCKWFKAAEVKRAGQVFLSMLTIFGWKEKNGINNKGET